MRKLHTLPKFLLVLVTLIFFSIATKAYTNYTPSSKVIKTEKLEITLNKVFSGVFNMNMMLEVTVKNLTNESVLFNPDDFELLDTKTNVAYYSIAKDKEHVEVQTVFSSSFIPRATVNPNRTIKGTVIISTPEGELKKVKHAKLTFQGQSVDLER